MNDLAHWPQPRYASGADGTGYRTLVTHHYRAQPWAPPGVESRRRHLVVVASWDVVRGC